MKDREYIYILLHEGKGVDLIKLGFSIDLKKRLYQYESYNPSISLLFEVQLENAKEFEKEFHKNHKAIYRNEWYSLDILDYIKEKINEWNINNPINEDDYPPLIQIQEIKEKLYSTNYQKVLEYFEDNHKDGVIDWGIYAYKTEWTNVIEQCYKLKGATFKNFTYAKKLLETEKDSFELYRSNIYQLFDIKARYKLKFIKETLAELYEYMKIPKVAKATDLKEVFLVREILIEKERGYEILEVLK